MVKSDSIYDVYLPYQNRRQLFYYNIRPSLGWEFLQFLHIPSGNDLSQQSQLEDPLLTQ